MFNEGINAFVKRYRGSRKEAGRAIGCSGIVVGQMLRGEMKVPPLRAFLIEEVSKGAIPASFLLKGEEPLLARAIEKSRHVYCQRLMNKSHYSLSEAPLIGIDLDASFPFCAYDYIKPYVDKTTSNLVPTVIVSERSQLLYGLNTIKQAISHNKATINLFVIDLTDLMKPRYTPLPIELKISQRVAVGVSLAYLFEKHKALNVQRSTKEKASKQPLKEEGNYEHSFYGVVERFISTCENLNKNIYNEIIGRVGIKDAKTYQQLQTVLKQGIPELRKAVDEFHIKADQAAKIAKLPRERQLSALR